MEFAEELSCWGPAGKNPAPSMVEARAYALRWALGSRENFPVLSWAVPKPLRRHFANVYAWCRWADHLADEVTPKALALEYLHEWRLELDRCFAGQPRHPVTVALRETVDEFALDRGPFLDLLGAFERDQSQTRYDSFDDFLDYCRGSANPVGRLVLFLCRCDSPDAVRFSDQVCTGLQLANFWQDVALDESKGRVYLPLEDMVRFGVQDGDVARGTAGVEFRRLILFEVERAESYLREGLPVSVFVPGRLGVAVAAFAVGGLAILQKIRDVGGDVLQSRPKLTKWQLAKTLPRAWRIRRRLLKSIIASRESAL